MKKKKKTLLWRIDHPRLPGSSYLFGTMHVRDRAAFAFLQHARRYLSECQALATELSLDTNISLQVSHKLLLPPGKTLADYLSPHRYDKIRTILLKAFGINADNFQHFVPIMLINVLSDSLLNKDFPRALDEELWYIAGGMGKERHGIETLEEQMNLMSRIPLPYQFAMLKSIARQVNRFRRQMQASAAMYQTGDPQLLYNAVKRSSQGLRHLILYRRNEIMAERIANIIQAQPTFCAIGAGHLGGKRGVLRLLKQQNLRLHPLPLPSAGILTREQPEK